MPKKSVPTPHDFESLVARSDLDETDENSNVYLLVTIAFLLGLGWGILVGWFLFT
jgi:hypothetical protein